MDTAVVSLVAFAAVLWATFTAIGGIFDGNEARAQAFDSERRQIYLSVDTALEVVGTDTTFGAGATNVDVTLTNTGRRSFATPELSEWEVYLDYQPVTGLDRRISRLSFTDSLSGDSWTVRDIYLDHTATEDELFSPGIFDPHEELVMRLQVDPLIKIGSEGRVVIYVPGSGQPLTAFFTIP